jgi:hypothetical protein
MDQLRLISLQSGCRRGHDDKSVDGHVGGYASGQWVVGL